MDCLSAEEGYCDQGDIDWSGDADAGSDLDFTFDSRLVWPLLMTIFFQSVGMLTGSGKRNTKGDRGGR